MLYGAARERVPGGEGVGPHGAEEAALDEFVVKESAFREWLRQKARQAPWWTISFLVHLIALLTAWHWPYVVFGERETDRSTPTVGLFHPDDILPPPPLDPPKVDWRDLDVDFKISPTEKELVRAPGPEDLKLTIKPSSPPPGPPEEKPTLSRGEIDPHAFSVREDTAPPRGLGKYGPRDKLSSGGGKGKGEKGGGTGDEELMIYVSPVTAGLIWLAKAQEPDGSWNAKSWGGSSPYPVGMTGLAVLAFEGAGYTHRKGRFEHTVARAMNWLRSNQRDDGSFPFETFYEQGIATMAVCEAFGLTRDPVAGQMAQRAIDYICRIQPEHGGFRYGGAVPKEQGDTSVTGWQIMAIKSAVMAGLKVPPQAVERSQTFLANTLRDYGASSYLVGSEGAGSLAMSAVGLACRIFLSDTHDYDNEIGQGARYLHGKETRDLMPVPGGASKELVADLYYTYYSSLAMFQAGDEYWFAWRTMYRDALIGAQIQEKEDRAGRYVRGSWDPAKERWGNRGGRVYTTAMALLSLEVPFRFIAVYRSRR